MVSRCLDVFLCRIIKPVKIIKVILPSSPSPTRSSSPIKLPVITSSHGQIRFTSPQPKIRSSHSSPVLKSPVEKLTNGLSSTLSNGDATIMSPTVPKSFSDARLKSPQIPKVPISPHARFEPSHYRYMVEEVQNQDEKHTLKPSLLSRPKGVFTPKKLRVFLRNSTYRTSEKQPFIVKVTSSVFIVILWFCCFNYVF